MIGKQSRYFFLLGFITKSYICKTIVIIQQLKYINYEQI